MDMGKKNKNQQAKRRAAKDLRRRQKKKVNRSMKAQRSTQTTVAQWLSQLPNAERNKFLVWERNEYHWWLAHGANFLVSDYDTGEWNPIFPVYNEEPVATPPQMLGRLYDVFGPEDPNGLAGAAWMVLEAPIVYGYTREIISRASKDGVDMPELEARRPHNGIMWEYLVNQIKSKVV